jgi:hypothetical protein
LRKREEGIDVTLDDGVIIHLDVILRRAASPTAVKIFIPDNLIRLLGVHVVHPKLQQINHLITLEEVDLQWKSLGFETHRPHYQLEDEGLEDIGSLDVGTAPPLSDMEEDLYAPALPKQRTALAPSAIPLYSPRFDSHLGYPGEGPQAFIASYNINGVKQRLREVRASPTRGPLLSRWTWDRSALGLRSLCRGFGWWVFLAPASSSDVKGDTAILIKNNSTKIKLTVNSRSTIKKPRRQTHRNRS